MKNDTKKFIISVIDEKLKTANLKDQLYLTERKKKLQNGNRKKRKIKNEVKNK